MKPTRIGPRFVCFDDGTNWPRAGTDVEWQARYGDVDKLTLAGFVGAYEALIRLPTRRRNEVIRALRETAFVEPDAAQPTPRGGGSDRG